MTDPKPVTPWGLKWRRRLYSPVDGWQYGKTGFATHRGEVLPACKILDKEFPHLTHEPHYFGDDKP